LNLPGIILRLNILCSVQLPGNFVQKKHAVAFKRTALPCLEKKNPLRLNRGLVFTAVLEG
jgi:hypothetical protein